VKVGATDAQICQPEEMEKLLKAAPELLLPYLAFGAFSGLRGAELARLDWSAVDLERRIIQLRAGQAKTASRRIVPISGNLAAWLSHVKGRKGKVITQKAVPRKSSDLAKSLGLS
jgi:integrase